ncbi:hypothetical protein P261_00370 [Lachnospiraceae bacterium TWA4]|nr:hypothetical protein P261_00370 [Lachnospiraceae bacterium TWA4]
MALILLVNVAMSIPIVAANTSNVQLINRHNVVIVLDASYSMNYSDKLELRYEAINQFVNLLTEKGNYLGGIVFSNHIMDKEDLKKIQSQGDKDQVVELLKSKKSTKVDSNQGYTNIGEALLEATNMLVNAENKDLSSEIVFLSDGETDLPKDTPEELEKSLENKADAIQVARDKNIKIYSICLNSNGKANLKEMEQISKATNGTFKEVSKPDDLKEVFSLFYNVIYDTTTCGRGLSIPQSGQAQLEFEIPGIGVEEVNILIDGNIKTVSLVKPNGKEAKTQSVNGSSRDFNFIKVTDLMAGKWKLVVTGDPGIKAEVNLVFNTDLGIDIQTNNTTITTDEALDVTAKLFDGEIPEISDSSQLNGYETELQVMDVSGNLVDTIPMNLDNNQFKASYQPSEGTYFIKAHTIYDLKQLDMDEKNNLEKESEVLGPINVTKAEEPKKPVNTAPVAVEDLVEKTVYIWPFKENEISFDLSSLFTDAENDSLTYAVDSSFMEDTDYIVENNIVTLKHFSLTKGDFNVKATDTGGLSSNVKVKIVTHNVGVMACIGLGIIAIIVLIVLGIITWKRAIAPFRVDESGIKVQTYKNGIYSGTPHKPMRGTCKLARFRIDNIGIDNRKSYFQATGKNYVILKTNIPVFCNGKASKKLQIKSGIKYTIKVKENDINLMTIEYKSLMDKVMKRKRPKPVKKPKAPKKR